MTEVTIQKKDLKEFLGGLAVMSQEGDPFQGSESGLLSDSRKRIVPGDTHAEKARDLMGVGWGRLGNRAW